MFSSSAAISQISGSGRGKRSTASASSPGGTSTEGISSGLSIVIAPSRYFSRISAVPGIFPVSPRISRAALRIFSAVTHILFCSMSASLRPEAARR